MSGSSPGASALSDPQARQPRGHLACAGEGRRGDQTAPGTGLGRPGLCLYPLPAPPSSLRSLPHRSLLWDLPHAPTSTTSPGDSRASALQGVGSPVFRHLGKTPAARSPSPVPSLRKGRFPWDPSVAGSSSTPAPSPGLSASTLRERSRWGRWCLVALPLGQAGAPGILGQELGWAGPLTKRM